MDLLLIRSLIAVAERGSVSRAARGLGLSQPALSRRLQQLEDELGAELLRRSGRGVALTELGRLAVDEGRTMVDRYDRLKQSLHELQKLDAGTVRIGGGATAVNYLLPQAIARFREAHPAVRFRLEEAGSRDVEVAVAEERLDLGIVTLPVKVRDVEATVLCRDRIVLIAASDHPLACLRSVGAEALQGQRLVGFEAGSALRQLIDDALHEVGVEMDVVMELRSVAAIRRMVETTSSLAFVSERGVEPQDRVVRVRGLRVERELGLIHARRRPPSSAAAAFAEGLCRLVR